MGNLYITPEGVSRLRNSKIYGDSYSWRQYEKRYTPKEKYKRTPLKEIAPLKYHTPAIEIGEMLLECKPYVQL